MLETAGFFITDDFFMVDVEEFFMVEVSATVAGFVMVDGRFITVGMLSRFFRNHGTKLLSLYEYSSGHHSNDCM